MEFITVEQFKEQPIEIQEMFLDWWEPSVGDLYCNEFSINFEGDKIQKLQTVTNTTDIDYIKDVSEFLCVLFTEGQLRKFIEDKLGVFLNIEIRNVGFIFWNFRISEEGRRKLVEYNIVQEDFNLLQAYWKIACSMAKEHIE